MAFNIGAANAERREAFALYQSAFDAVEIAEFVSFGGDVHILMQIDELRILLAPGGKTEKIVENAMCCEYEYDTAEEFHAAYARLSQGALHSSLEGPFPWADLLGLVTDKFGICWALYLHKK